MAVRVKVPDRGIHSLKAKLLSYISRELSSPCGRRATGLLLIMNSECSLGPLQLSPDTVLSQPRHVYSSCTHAVEHVWEGRGCRVGGRKSRSGSRAPGEGIIHSTLVHVLLARAPKFSSASSGSPHEAAH